MNSLQKVIAAVSSLIFSLLIGGICYISTADFSLVTASPAILIVCLYAFLSSFRHIMGQKASATVVMSSILAGIAAPAFFALHLIEKHGTLHGVAMWFYPLSILIIGYGFGKHMMLRLAATEPRNRPSPEIFIIPGLVCVIALIILQRAAIKVPPHPVLLNLYFGLMFSLFAEQLDTDTRSLASAGGLIFPLLFIFSGMFASDYSQLSVVVAITFFILGFIDGTNNLSRQTHSETLPAIPEQPL